MKRFLTVCLALAMALSLSVAAFATQLTINEPTGLSDATYEGYKILNSTNSESDTAKFSYTLNEKYAAIVKSVTGKTTESAVVTYISGLDADGMASFAKALYAAIKEATLAADKSGLKTGVNTVDEGYWLIAQTSGAADGETQSLLIVNTAGKDALTIESKKKTVTIEKTVTDESQLTCTKTHTHTAECYSWTKTNETPIGAAVKFKIETSIPSNMKDYAYTPYFIIGDTLSEGLDLVSTSVAVYIGGAKATAGSGYTLKAAPDCAAGYSFQIAVADPKANAGKAVVIYYDATLNSKAVLDTKGNPNEAIVLYSANTKEKSGSDGGRDATGFPKTATYVPDGKTTKAFTITYATGLVFEKVDGNKNPLTGAAFTITGTTETSSLKWEQKYVAVTAGTGTLYLLANGKYTDVAPVLADTMVEQKNATEFAGGYVVADLTALATDTDITVDSVRYRLATEADFGVNTIYDLVKSTAADYAETTANYNYFEGFTTQTATKAYSATVTVDENGVANLPGLAAGTYHISEIKTPEGYNTIEDFDVVIVWNAPSAATLTANGKNAECTWTATVGDKSLALKDITDIGSLFELQVVNQSGSELPSTGGIGTYIFYIIGGLLVVIAGVLFITKKRMNNK